ncbi:MAG TPA: two-component system response regulator CreB [Candidatus Polarisedimenticolia bacterium]|nr:two-component system response regulator CreB [Candidatus Polarisedimenticolia bacterium]
MKARILIVDDEPAILDNIQYVLEAEGLDTLRLSEGLAVLPTLAKERVDLILLDIGLPDISGLDLCREIRRAHGVPIIFLTARSAEIDRVLGLEMGADDYVPKPFSPRELSARVKAVLRRTAAAAPPRGRHPAFVVDTDRRRIDYRGRTLELSRTEFELLVTFLRRPGQVYSREQLKSIVWEQPGTSLERSVDGHIKNLRAKLKAVDPDGDPIVTHRGVGYSLKESW